MFCCWCVPNSSLNKGGVELDLSCWDYTAFKTVEWNLPPVLVTYLSSLYSCTHTLSTTVLIGYCIVEQHSLSCSPTAYYCAPLLSWNCFVAWQPKNKIESEAFGIMWVINLKQGRWKSMITSSLPKGNSAGAILWTSSFHEFPSQHHHLASVVSRGL